MPSRNWRSSRRCTRECFTTSSRVQPSPSWTTLPVASRPRPDPNLPLAAYGLLDEVLATGLAPRSARWSSLRRTELGARLAAPRKLYDDPFIDAVTKAFLPELSALLRQPMAGRAVFSPEFQSGLPRIGEGRFPARSAACSRDSDHWPAAYSKRSQKAYDALRHRHRLAFGQQLRPTRRRATRSPLLEDHSTWGRVLLLKTDELDVLHRYVKSLPASAASFRAAGRQNQRFAYATRAASSGPVFGAGH